MFRKSLAARAGGVFSVAIFANLGFQVCASLLIVLFSLDLQTNFAAFAAVQFLLPVCVFGCVFAFVYAVRPPAPQQILGWTRKPRLSDLALCALLGIAVCFSSGFLNECFSALLNYIGIPNAVSFPEPQNAAAVLAFVLAMCILPALSEEFCFRGALTSYLSGRSVPKICLLSGLLFALMHMNLAQMLNAFLVGMLLTLVTLRTGSVWPAVVLHFMNNLTTVVEMMVTPADAALFLGFSLFDLIAAGVCLLPIVLLVLYYALRRPTVPALPAETDLPQGADADFWIAALPGILAAVALTVLQTLL